MSMVKVNQYVYGGRKEQRKKNYLNKLNAL